MPKVNEGSQIDIVLKLLELVIQGKYSNLLALMLHVCFWFFGFFFFNIFSKAYNHFNNIIQNHFLFIQSHIRAHIQPDLAVVACLTMVNG